MTIVGSIGLIGYMQKDITPCNFTENCAVVKSKKITPKFMLAIFISKIGQGQINREKVGTIQDKLALERLRNFLIPKPKSKILETEITNLVKHADENYQKSKDLYSQAEQILLDELGLKGLDLKDDLFYTTPLNKVKDSNRMDTEYYLPKYNTILDAIHKVGYKRFSDIAQFSKAVRKTKKDAYYKYIEISDIDVSSGDVNYAEIQENDLPANAKLKILGGELIISKVRPTRGAVAIIPENFKDDFLCSGAFSVFKVKTPFKEYIQVFLRSQIGKALLGRPCTGTQYPTLKDDDVKAIPIPNIERRIVDNIAEKVHAKEGKKICVSILTRNIKKIECMFGSAKNASSFERDHHDRDIC